MTDRDGTADMHACVVEAVPAPGEREDPRDTRACDTRVIHEGPPRVQVVIRDWLSLHVGEAAFAVRAGWPFSGPLPTAPELAAAVGRLFATPVRTAGVAATVVLATAVTLLVHAAS